MRLNKLFIVLLAMFSLLTSCEEPIENNNENNDLEFETRLSNGSVSIENGNTSNLSVASLIDESSLSNGSFSVEVFDNNLPQLLMVTNETSEVIMLYKGVIPENGNIEINAHSTATAILTFHPALAEIKGANYQEMVNVFTSASSFPAFLSEVENSIAQNKAIYDTTNTNLISAAQEVFSELFGDSTNSNYKNKKDFDLFLPYLTKKFDCKPICVESNDDSKTLSFRMPGLFPTYNCKVYDEEGNYERSFYVPTRGNYGLWDAFLCAIGQNDLVYGDQVSYTFNNNAKQRTFEFNRDGLSTTLQIAGSITDALGIDKVDPVFYDELIHEVGIDLEPYIETFDIKSMFLDVIPVLFEATLEKLEKKDNVNISSKAKKALRILRLVNIIENVGNPLGRLGSHWLCRNEITFCAQYYSPGFFDKCGAGYTYNASVKCNWADSYIANFTLNLPYEEEYQIPSTTIYTYDYDGTGLKLVYSGNYHELDFNLTVSTYKAEDNSLIRTDVFSTAWFVGDTISLNGNATYNTDLEGCPMVLELIGVYDINKKSKTILNQVTNKNSRTNQCTIIGH
ncbi:MAG: hypothetical protein IIW76_06835 [Bacteroidales bacterium]|nr:hypothetical protein [Bacteroidales bacterium]